MKKYHAKPIVETKVYDNVADVMQLVDDKTHRVKVEKNGEIIGRLKLKKTACIIDGEVKEVKVAKVRKNQKSFKSWSQSVKPFRLPNIQGWPLVILAIVFMASCLSLVKLIPCLAVVSFIGSIALLCYGTYRTNPEVVKKN